MFFVCDVMDFFLNNIYGLLDFVLAVSLSYKNTKRCLYKRTPFLVSHKIWFDFLCLLTHLAFAFKDISEICVALSNIVQNLVDFGHSKCVTLTFIRSPPTQSRNLQRKSLKFVDSWLVNIIKCFHCSIRTRFVYAVMKKNFTRISKLNK